MTISKNSPICGFGHFHKNSDADDYDPIFDLTADKNLNFLPIKAKKKLFTPPSVSFIVKNREFYCFLACSASGRKKKLLNQISTQYFLHSFSLSAMKQTIKKWKRRGRNFDTTKKAPQPQGQKKVTSPSKVRSWSRLVSVPNPRF